MLSTQGKPRPAADLPASVNRRVRAVENQLCPYVPVAGMAGWNLEQRMRHHRVPGLSIAVIHNYQLDWAKSYGWADTTKKTPVTEETLFSAGSVSKLVAALAALKLVEQGKLDLDKPVNGYLTSWQLPESEFTKATPVTLRMLLSHTGATSQSGYFGFTPQQQPLPPVVDILSGKPGVGSRAVVVNSQPGKEFRYSGGGYLVAQQAMTDATGQDFAGLTDQLLFKPLGLRHTTFAQPLPEALSRKAAWAYSTAGWFKGMPYLYPQQAAAGLYTTASDLARLLIAVQNAFRGQGTFLSQPSARALVTPQVDVSEGFYKEQMGLGAFLLQRGDNHDPKGVYFEHTGVNAGFIAYALGSLEGGNGVVILMNSDGAAGELGKEIRRAVARAYGWPGFLPDPIRPVPLPETLLAQYEGRYKKGLDEVVTIRREKDYLVETINDGNPIYCFPVGKDTVAFTDYTLKGYFARGAGGKVDSLRIEWHPAALPRLAEGEYLPGELLRMGRYEEAINGYRSLKLNESQLTYMAYEFLHARPARLPAARALLTLAQEQHPNSAMVFARWGDLYQKLGQVEQAIAAYQAALRLDPNDKDAQEKLLTLQTR
ncbi:MAG: class A beta-lactamase-related serine hydrolase [Cytophagales bacterium]|nr:class A beta-lactamase-related serine hydrolase [Cytophagales bacterium]